MSNSTDKEGWALSKPEYWDEKYRMSDGKQPTHEWFKSYDALRPFFAAHLFGRPTDIFLAHLGSGDSLIPDRLAAEGYRNQLCVDFSSAVVRLMASNAQKGVNWMQADVRNMTEIQSQSVDVAFDKGTLDAMIYGSPWDPPDEVKRNTAAYMNEVGKIHITARQASCALNKSF